MKNSVPHAMSTLNRVITRAQPPNCPKRFTNTNTVAKNYWIFFKMRYVNQENVSNQMFDSKFKKKYYSNNTFPHPQLISIYSLCSFHWNHIRKPSSKNVAIKQNLAIVGRMCFPFLITCYQNISTYIWFALVLLREKKKWKFIICFAQLSPACKITTTITT